MPHRKLVQIGTPAAAPPTEPLPTVSQYFSDLAKRQAEDIRLLKERAQALADARAARAKQKSIREESWRLHPVIAMPTDQNTAKHSRSPKRTRKKTATKKRASKRAGKSR